MNPDDIDEDLVGRCYTKARRAPLVHGVVRSFNGGPSFRLPFGPYTLTQLAAIVISVGLLILARPLWGGHGLADIVVLLAVPCGAAFGMRHLHIDGRNPAAAAASVALMLASPRWGRIHGRPLRPARPWRDAPQATFAQTEPSDTPAPAPAHAPRAGRPSGDAGPHRMPATPMASGVQALLAHRPAGTDLEN
ncbi:hypothetical protein [Streptomyces sp. NPDC004230]